MKAQALGALLISLTITSASAMSKCEKKITDGDGWDEWIEKVDDDKVPKDCLSPFDGTKNKGDDWKYARKKNKKIIEDAKDRKVDLAMVGDSLIEKWQGTKRGKTDEKFKSNKKVYKDLFFDEKVEGVAIGIGGDGCSRLLYRLQNGELDGSGLDPDVWLVQIGTNDMDECGPEVVAACIINIAKYIESERPSAKVLLNSLLPRKKHDLGDYKKANKALECYAETQGDDVHFLDVFDLFLDDGEIDEDLLPDGIHPGKEGCKKWGRAIVKEVSDIM